MNHFGRLTTFYHVLYILNKFSLDKDGRVSHRKHSFMQIFVCIRSRLIIKIYVIRRNNKIDNTRYSRSRRAIHMLYWSESWNSFCSRATYIRGKYIFVSGFVSAIKSFYIHFLRILYNLMFLITLIDFNFGFLSY